MQQQAEIWFEIIAVSCIKRKIKIANERLVKSIIATKSYINKKQYLPPYIDNAPISYMDYLPPFLQGNLKLPFPFYDFSKISTLSPHIIPILIREVHTMERLTEF